MVEDWFGNTVICTAVTGGYDMPTVQMVSPGVDYIYFTDGQSLFPIGSPWKVEYLPEQDAHLDNRRRSKRPKLDPHSIPILNDYKYFIWIDGEISVHNPFFVPEILSYMKNGFVVSPHSDSCNEEGFFTPLPIGRHCAYGEATIRPPKYANEPLDEQVEFYQSQGFPHNYGLYSCGVSARDMTNKKVKEIGSLWHEQNLTWSYQDQVSFPYCLWKVGFEPDVLPKSLYHMNWLWLNLHTRED